MVSRLRNTLFAWLLLALSLSACRPVSAVAPAPGAGPAVTFTAVQVPSAASETGQPGAAQNATAPVTETSAATAAPTEPASPQRSIWMAESVPQQLREALRLPAGWQAAAAPEQASLRMEILSAQARSPEIIPWVYALAAPFPTITDDLTMAELQSGWKGTPSEALPFNSLLVEPATAAAFTAVWGAPSAAVHVKPAGQLLDAAWAKKTTWAIVPFERLEPRWKVIAVDGQSPVRKDFVPARYGLTVQFALQGDSAALGQYLAEAPPLEGNRRADRLTTVMVTGVTALVRGTASLMETRGLDYPAQDIGDWLREADILHISNEVPFWKTCPEPYNWKGLVFCSRAKYIQLLRDVGADVIELTGDHFQDWGPEAMLYTLDLYQQEGWPVYGGGANIEEARQPALFEHNGNKIAFIGCNAKPKGYATASEKTPGALHCDMDQLAEEVQKLRADGYQPVVTFQHLEYYSYTAHPILQKDFRQMAKAGAAIVSGSQAHQPHALEFDSGALLHYGLGNLFFDQTNQGDAPRTAFIDRHVFYDGRLVTTELLTIYLVDYARSRPMTLPERQELLKDIFEASGW